MAAAIPLFFLIIPLLITPSLATGEEIPLLDFKESLNDSSALDSTWLRGTHPCQSNWIGVECDVKDRVYGLLLIGLGLSGVADEMDIDSLGRLNRLRFLSLENNSFTGRIPDFNKLTSLRSLFIGGNQFSGEIPQDFFTNMNSLKKLEMARNRFSGTIPLSLGKLDSLAELYLERNEFSGGIPLFEQKSLVIINLSYNKLKGEVPQSMARFGAESFEGNPDLCGLAINKQCLTQSQVTNVNAPPSVANRSNASGSSTKWIILGIVVAVLLVTIFFNKNKTEDNNFRVLGKDHCDDVVQVHTPSTHKRSMSSSRRRGSYGGFGTGSSRRGSLNGKSTDLIMVNEENGIFGLNDLMKAAAEVLGSGNLGSAYKAMMSNGVSVVVKRFRDMNKLNKDVFDTEARRFGKIRHRNILPLLAYHYRKEEKLLVSEFVPKGSLMFILHGDRGVSHAELTWPTRLKIIKGVARGMGFLHTEFSNYELPHGNLKSSNILLSTNYEPLLTDYALNSLINNTQLGTALFAYKSPEAVLYEQLSPKNDVYCLGIVILEVMTGKYPSQYLNNHKGGTDVVEWIREAVAGDRLSEVIDPEIANAKDSIGQMETMLYIGASCTESDPEKRMEMREVIRKIEEIQV